MLMEKEARDIIRNDLGICVCGNPEIVMGFVHKALQLLKDEWRLIRQNEYKSNAQTERLTRTTRQHFRDETDDLFYWMAWYFIDRAGLLEHGGCIGGSWLSKKGESFLEYLNAHTLKEIFPD